MQYVRRWDDMLESFARSFPVIYEKAVSWYPSGQHEITIRMSDGCKIFYNSMTDSIRTTREIDYQTVTSEPEWRKRFSTKMLYKLRESGVTQKDLAEMTGLSQAIITRYINGSSSPSGYNVLKIASALGCSASELIDNRD